MTEGKAWWETVTVRPPRNASWLGGYPGPFNSDNAFDEMAGIADAPDVESALTTLLADFGQTEPRIYMDDAEGAARLLAAALDRAVRPGDNEHYE